MNGKGQVARRWDAKGQLQAFQSVDGYDYAVGEAAAAYLGPMEQFRRHVVHARPGVFVMFDDLRAAQPATFQWLLHAYNKIQVEEASRVLHISNAPASMNVHLLLPEKVTFSQTDQYEPEPESTTGRWEKTWHLSVATVNAARSAKFLSVFLPYREGTGDTLPRIERLDGHGAVGVRLAWPDGAEDLIAFRTDQDVRIVSCGGFESDGSVFARGMDSQGQTVRSLKHPHE